VKWVAAVVAALGAIVVANVLLLGYGETHNDPVGRLSPVAAINVPTTGTTLPTVSTVQTVQTVPTVPTTTTDERGHKNDSDD